MHTSYVADGVPDNVVLPSGCRVHCLLRILFPVVIISFAALYACPSKRSNPTLMILEKASSVAETEMNDTATAIAFRDLATRNVSDSVVYNRVYNFGKSLFYQGRQTVAFDMMRQFLAELENHSMKDIPLQRFRINCLVLLGASSDEIGLRNLSMDFYMRGLQVADEIGCREITGALYNNIGVSHYRVLDNEKAEYYFRKALDINKTLKRKHDMFLNYNNLSEIYCYRADYDKALNMALSAIECLDEKRDADDYYSMQCQIGYIYRLMNNREMALVYLDNAYRHQKKEGGELLTAETCLQLADYYSQYGPRDSVSRYVAEGRRLAVAAGHPSLMVEVLRRESSLAEIDGDYRSMASVERRINAITDSLSIVENRSNAEQVLHIYETERLMSETAFPMARWNPVVVFVSMGFLILVIVVVFVVYLVTKRRRDQAVAAEIKMSHELEMLRGRQLAEEREKKACIQAELDHKHRNLTAFSLEKLKTSQQLAEIDLQLKSLLRSLSPRDRENRDSVKEILRGLARINYSSDWEEFHYYFEKVEPDFYRRLTEAHPGLTKNDQRLCALIWLGLNTKDIASLTFREVRSVESSRNRLRKKMNMAPTENLYDYIRQFASERSAAAGMTEGADEECEDEKYSGEEVECACQTAE